MNLGLSTYTIFFTQSHLLILKKKMDTKKMTFKISIHRNLPDYSKRVVIFVSFGIIYWLNISYLNKWFRQNISKVQCNIYQQRVRKKTRQWPSCLNQKYFEGYNNLLYLFTLQSLQFILQKKKTSFGKIEIDIFSSKRMHSSIC